MLVAPEHKGNGQKNSQRCVTVLMRWAATFGDRSWFCGCPFGVFGAKSGGSTSDEKEVCTLPYSESRWPDESGVGRRSVAQEVGVVVVFVLDVGDTSQTGSSREATADRRPGHTSDAILANECVECSLCWCELAKERRRTEAEVSITRLCRYWVLTHWRQLLLC